MSAAADRVRRVLRRLDAWSVAATAAVVAPIVFHAVRAALGNWRPVGDDAYFTLRSLDVATAHHPLLGAWSSASIDVDRSVNNLGPLQLDLLAPFTRWAPAGGTAIGVAAVHAAAIVTAAWLLHRLGGRVAVVVGAVPMALLAWNMGSEMLLSARQHQFLLFACLAFLVSAWAAAAGVVWALVPLVFWASLLTQTHLSYPIIVAVVGAVAAAGWTVAWRRDRLPARRRAVLVAGGVAFVVWLQPLVDQFAGWGNLGDVLTTPGQVDRLGWRGSGIVVDVLLTPTGHLRPGYARFDPAAAVTHGGTAAIVLVVALVASAVAAVWSTVRHHVRAAAGLGVATAAVAGAWLDTALLPVTEFGLAQFNYRWLWPIGTFCVVGALIAAVELARRRAPNAFVPAVLGVSIAATGALAVANLPRSYQVLDPDRTRDEQATAIIAAEQVERLDLTGPVLVDQSNLYFGHPFNYPIAVAVRNAGAAYRFEGAIQRRRFGADRVADGSEPTRLVLWAGDDARERADDPDTVVFVDTATALAITLETR